MLVHIVLDFFALAAELDMLKYLYIFTNAFDTWRPRSRSMTSWSMCPVGGATLLGEPPWPLARSSVMRSSPWPRGSSAAVTVRSTTVDLFVLLVRLGRIVKKMLWMICGRLLPRRCLR